MKLQTNVRLYGSRMTISPTPQCLLPPQEEPEGVGCWGTKVSSYIWVLLQAWPIAADSLQHAGRTQHTNTPRDALQGPTIHPELTAGLG